MTEIKCEGSTTEVLCSGIDEEIIFNERSLEEINNERNQEEVQYLLNTLDEKTANDLRLDSKELNKLVDFMNMSLSGPAGSVAMRCLGEKCIEAKSCPFTDKKKWPMGKRCPMEVAIMKRNFDNYCKTLDVDITNRVERTIVQDMVSMEIYEARLNNILGSSGGDNMIIDNIFSINEATGDPLFIKAENPAWKMLLKCRERRDQLLDELAATRKQQLKLDTDKNEPYDKRIQRVKKRIAELKNKAIEATVIVEK